MRSTIDAAGRIVIPEQLRQAAPEIPGDEGPPMTADDVRDLLERTRR